MIVIMREESRVRSSLMAVVVLAICARPCSAQADVSLVDRTLLAVAATLEEAIEEAAKVQAACEAVSDFLDALGRASERRAVELLLGELRRHRAGPFLVSSETATALFDEVRYQRTRGRPERMVPALLALQTRYPDDARVLYCLGEAFGVQSAIFDPGRAEGYFDELLSVLREEGEIATEAVGRGRLLSAFLPELSQAGLLLRERETDTSAWLRRHVMRFRESLSQGDAIGLWRLADPRLDNLYEQLIVARRAFDQARCRELLEAMLRVNPVHPVLQHALAEVYVSGGPEFNPEKATACLDEFLRLTDPAVLGGPDDRRDCVMTADDIVDDLTRFRLAQPRSDLEAQRVAALELRQAMQAKVPEKFLLVPDQGYIRSREKKLESRMRTCEGRIARVERALESNRNKLARFRNQRGSAPKVREFENKILEQEKEIGERKVEVAEIEVELARIRAIGQD